MKHLLVGDVHAVPEELVDCSRLIDGIRRLLHKQDVDSVVFLGDQYNTHSVMRVEVMAFWKDTFAALAKSKPVVALVGNHDRAANGFSHAMLAHEDSGVWVVDKPSRLLDDVLFVPWMKNADEFVAVCNQYPKTKYLVCHQTFDGAKYENGFYAPDGVSPDAIPQEVVFSGHIHTPQSFGKVRYIGAPRWRTLSDANIDRFVTLVDYDTGTTTNFSTADWCKVIMRLDDSPGHPAMRFAPNSNVDVRIDVRGPAAYLETRVPELEATGAKVRAFRTDLATTPRVRESDGVRAAFARFLTSWKAPRGTDLATLEAMATARLAGTL